MKKINTFIIYFLSFIFLEFAFRGLVLDSIFISSSVIMIIYVFFLSAFLNFATKLFNDKINKTLFFINMIAITIWFCAQYVLKTFFGFYLTFSILGLADQVGNGFMADAVTQVISRLKGIILLFLPLLGTFLFRNKISFKHNKAKKSLSLLMFSLIIFGVYYVSLYIIDRKSDYSPYILFHSLDDPSANIEKVGVLNTFFLDGFKIIINFEEELSVVKNKKSNVQGEYNNLSFDFEKLLNETNDSRIKTMTQYFMNEEGTLKNEYTSFFEGKNLVLFMAESFNGVVISKELTPTLYKLANSGFSFTNFYTPSINSTIGGEMSELTGLYPESVTNFRKNDNYYPMGIATLFQEAGYNTYAYHDNGYSFQNRDQYLKRLGFSNYKACNNGIEKLMDCTWLEMDSEMIEATVSEYVNDKQPFMVFYATVSGHGDYNKYTRPAKKYWDEINKVYPDIQDETKAYIAGQMELDRALESLINKLKIAGKLDNTVIALVGDHAPYYLYESFGLDYVNSISTYERDKNIELFHSNFILWNNKMDTVYVDKVGCQMDVLPTIYNLFGLSYDSRLIMGKDLLSTSEGIAILNNNYWVSDEGKYWANKGKFEQTSTNTLEDDYYKNIIAIINNRKIMSQYIIDKNYYKIIWKYKN